jgi:hypothetical protein
VRETPRPCLEKPFHFSQVLQLIPKEKPDPAGPRVKVRPITGTRSL